MFPAKIRKRLCFKKSVSLDTRNQIFLVVRKMIGLGVGSAYLQTQSSDYILGQVIYLLGLSQKDLIKGAIE